MSLAVGSSTAASIWVARKTRLEPSSPCSSARTEDGRPMTKGIIMWGNTTTSRIGIIGIRSKFLAGSKSVILFLSGLLQKGKNNFFVLDHFTGNQEFLNLLLGRQFIHDI